MDAEGVLVRFLPCRQSEDTADGVLGVQLEAHVDDACPPASQKCSRDTRARGAVAHGRRTASGGTL